MGISWGGLTLGLMQSTNGRYYKRIVTLLRQSTTAAFRWGFPLVLSGWALGSQGGLPTAAQEPPAPGLLTLDELAQLRVQPFAATDGQLRTRGWRLVRQYPDQRFGCRSYWWAYPPRQPGQPADSLCLAVYPGDGSWNFLSHHSASRRQYALVRATVQARRLPLVDQPYIVQETDSSSQRYRGPQQYVTLAYDASRPGHEYYLRIQRRNPQQERSDSIARSREAPRPGPAEPPLHWKYGPPDAKPQAGPRRPVKH
jgi:hypothetical protein